MSGFNGFVKSKNNMNQVNLVLVVSPILNLRYTHLIGFVVPDL